MDAYALVAEKERLASDPHLPQVRLLLFFRSWFFILGWVVAGLRPESDWFPAKDLGRLAPQHLRNNQLPVHWSKAVILSASDSAGDLNAATTRAAQKMNPATTRQVKSGSIAVLLACQRIALKQFTEAFAAIRNTKQSNFRVRERSDESNNMDGTRVTTVAAATIETKLFTNRGNSKGPSRGVTVEIGTQRGAKFFIALTLVPDHLADGWTGSALPAFRFSTDRIHTCDLALCFEEYPTLATTPSSLLRAPDDKPPHQ